MTGSPTISITALHDACQTFATYTRPDRSYRVLNAVTGGRPDLTRAEHRQALHGWLNAWGCRIAYPRPGGPDLFADSVAEWWSRQRLCIPSPGARLANLTDPELDRLAEAYADLWRRPVAPGRRPGSFRTLAPTATAKTLWAIRPHAVTAWDARIARCLHGGRDGLAFAAHLRLARDCAGVLLLQAGSEQALLTAVGRPDSTVAKLLDEYWYITVSRG